MARIHDGEAPMFTIDKDGPTAVFYDETGDNAGIEVSAGWSTIDEDVKLIMIDTAGDVGRVRIMLNGDDIYDADPETGLPGLYR
jgi:hypothetical protein